MDARKSEKILYICTGICCLLIIGGGALTALELPGMTALIVVASWCCSTAHGSTCSITAAPTAVPFSAIPC